MPGLPGDAKERIEAPGIAAGDSGGGKVLLLVETEPAAVGLTDAFVGVTQQSEAGEGLPGLPSDVIAHIMKK